MGDLIPFPVPRLQHPQGDPPKVPVTTMTLIGNYIMRERYDRRSKSHYVAVYRCNNLPPGSPGAVMVTPFCGVSGGDAIHYVDAPDDLPTCKRCARRR